MRNVQAAYDKWLRKGREVTPEGAEIPDPVPVAPPLGYDKPLHMTDYIRQMIASERLAQEAA